MNTVKGIGRAIYRAIGYYPVHLNGIPLRGDPYHFRFWRMVNRHEWENDTFGVLDRYLQPTSTYLDIGAWIGPTVLYAAQRCQMVYCIEPDYTAYRYLLWNLELNGLHNVQPFNVALTETTGMRQMAAPKDRLGDSNTSLVRQRPGGSMIQVFAMGWADWLKGVNPTTLDLIKIDIEGGEFSLIPVMRDYLAASKPPLYLSLHPTFLDKADRREAMAHILEVLSIYRTCLDSSFKPVDVRQLTTDAALERLGAYVFVDD